MNAHNRPIVVWVRKPERISLFVFAVQLCHTNKSIRGFIDWYLRRCFSLWPGPEIAQKNQNYTEIVIESPEKCVTNIRTNTQYGPLFGRASFFLRLKKPEKPLHDVCVREGARALTEIHIRPPATVRLANQYELKLFYSMKLISLPANCEADRFISIYRLVSNTHRYCQIVVIMWWPVAGALSHFQSSQSDIVWMEMLNIIYMLSIDWLLLLMFDLILLWKNLVIF